MGTKFSGSPEAEMIRLLESINTSLKSTPLTKRSVQPDRKSITQTSRTVINSELKAAIKPLQTAAGKAADKLLLVRDNAGKLSRTIGITKQRFFDLNVGVKNFIKTLSSAKFELPKIPQQSTPLDEGASSFNTDGIINATVDVKHAILDVHSLIKTFANNRPNPPPIIVPPPPRDNGVTNNFNTDDVVHATVGVKHTILDVHKAFTKTSIDNTNSIIDAINKSNLSYIKVQQDTVASTNELIRTVIALMRKVSISTQPAAIQPEPPANNASPVTTEATTVPATTSADTAPSLPPSNTAPDATRTNAEASAARTTETNTSARTRNTSSLISNNRIISQMIISKAREMNSVNAASNAMMSLAKVIEAVTKQFFYLAEMGMGSMGNLYDLNVAAVKSGMAMRDYNDMLVKNMTFASRAGSIDNFDAITSANNKYLASLGIFGESAKRLQVGIAETSTQMGIAQADIPDTSRQLIGVFERLNKTVSMTSDEFMNSILAVKENSAYIEEASGLNQGLRSARLVELTEAYNFGRTLGLTAEESNKLGKAMMEQRKMNVQDRFKESANVMQLAALTGNQAMIPEIQRLYLKRTRSAPEEAQLTQMLGKIGMDGRKTMENTQNLGYENAFISKQEELSSATQARMEASMRGELAGESKPLGQDAFGKHVGEFGQFVGNLTTLLSGIQKNDVLMPTLGFLTAGLTLVFGQAIMKFMFTIGRDVRSGGIAKAFTGLSGNLSSLLSNLALSAKNAIMAPFRLLNRLIPTMTAASTGSTGILSKLFNFFPEKLNGLIAGIKNLFSKIPSLPASLTSIPAKLGSFLGSLGSAIPAKLSGMFSGITSGMQSLLGKTAGVGAGIMAGMKRIPYIGQVIAVLMEAITGDLRNAFSPNGSWMNAIGSMIVAIPYEFGNFILSGLEWVFGENLLKPIRTMWDSLAAAIMYGLNSVVAKIASGISWIVDFLPDDSKLNIMVKQWKANTQRTADETGETLKRTWNGETLSKISDENKKLANKVTTENAAATDKVQKSASAFNNTQAGMLLSDPRNDARSLTEGSNQTPAPKPVTAEPETKPKTSLQKTQDSQGTQQPTTDGKTASKEGEDPILTTMNSMLNVLNEILIEEKLTNALLGSIKPTSMSDSLSKLMFGDSTNAQKRLLGNQ